MSDRNPKDDALSLFGLLLMAAFLGSVALLVKAQGDRMALARQLHICEASQ